MTTNVSIGGVIRLLFNNEFVNLYILDYKILCDYGRYFREI
jgi:hypothetical protein